MLARMVARRRSPALVLLTATVMWLSMLVAAPSATAATSSTLTMELSSTELRPGESLWITGSLTTNGVALAGATVYLQYRTGSNASWQNVTTTTVNSGGAYSFQVRPTVLGHYRTVYTGSARYAASVRGAQAYTWGAGRRALEARYVTIPYSHLGRATSTFLNTTYNGVPVRWVTYQKGTLVEYGIGSKIRTWYVTGEANRIYLANGGPAGKLGIPILDAECGLLENGCLQRFSGGSVYYGPAARQTGVYFGSGQQTELIATALSQAGYKAPSNNISKYNNWAGSNYAWCSIFQSWVTVASGNSGVIPVSSRFSYFHSQALSWGRTGKSPSIGALAFFDTHTSDGVSAATHVGLVYGYNSRYIWTIEGNTSPTDGTSGRGVYLKKRLIGHPMYYVHPVYGS